MYSEVEQIEEGWEEIDDQSAEFQAYLNPPILPSDLPLTSNQFYVMLENEGKIEAFISAIETVTPISKKLTCRNQFNNSTDFTWDMILVQTVMPLASIYGPSWADILSPIWINAYSTIDSGFAP